MTKTKYFPTRKAATAAAKPKNATFKDKGAKAKKGKRWAVITTTGTAKSKAMKSKARATSSKKGTGKKPRAIKIIVKALEKDVSRKDTLNKLVRQLDLTPAGASTYYANVKNGTWTLADAEKKAA